MNWTLIFCDEFVSSPQVFHVEGADPGAEARSLKAAPGNEWLSGYALVAAVPGHHAVATRDDAHSFDECTLHMNGTGGVPSISKTSDGTRNEGGNTP